VEKILEAEERLPAEWPVHGTTGYDFMNLMNGLFLDAAAAAKLERFYRIFTRDPLPADEILYRSKRIIMRTALAGELNVLANALARIAEADHHTRDFTLNNLRNALFEVVACFPVYRTYLAPGHVTEDDRRHVQLAVEAAKRRSTAGDVSVFDFVREAMLTSIADGKTEAFRRQVLTFAMKLQQRDRQGHGRHNVLHLQPPDLAQRGRRGPAPLRSHAHDVSPREPRTPEELAACDARELHARQ
jgi:(1->4)-alpha-D-glucan 1-alpha-D-glucosylmutase